MLLLSICFLVHFSSPAVAQEELRTEDLAQEQMDMGEKELCRLYRRPLDGMRVPVRPLLLSRQKIRLRAEQGSIHDQHMKYYELRADPAASAFTESMELWLRQSAAALHLARPHSVKIQAFDQPKICAEEVEKKLGYLLKTPKEDSVRKDIVKSMEAMLRSCLAKTQANANFILNKIYLGSSLASNKPLLSVEKMIMLHELCHLEYPGIAGQAQEEIFCDAVAWKWMESLSGTLPAPQMRQEYSRVILGNNPGDDLLILRSRLPLACF
jgi:hypothetical protein